MPHAPLNAPLNVLSGARCGARLLIFNQQNQTTINKSYNFIKCFPLPIFPHVRPMAVWGFGSEKIECFEEAIMYIYIYMCICVPHTYVPHIFAYIYIYLTGQSCKRGVRTWLQQRVWREQAQLSTSYAASWKFLRRTIRMASSLKRQSWRQTNSSGPPRLLPTKWKSRQN